MDVPEVELSILVTPSECLQARKQNKFIAPDGKTLNIVPGQSVVYAFVEDGSITVDSTNT